MALITIFHDGLQLCELKKKKHQIVIIPIKLRLYDKKFDQVTQIKTHWTIFQSSLFCVGISRSSKERLSKRFIIRCWKKMHTSLSGFAVNQRGRIRFVRGAWRNSDDLFSTLWRQEKTCTLRCLWSRVRWSLLDNVIEDVDD